MPSVTRCPECNGQLQVPEEFFGRKVKCPTCGAQFTAKADGSTAAATPPAPQPRREDHEDEYDDEPRPRRRRRSANYEPHRGTTVLVLGILSIVLGLLGLIFGPIAWTMGNNDLKSIRAGIMDPEGEGLTSAGRICGIIGTIIGILGCVCTLFYVIIVVGAVQAGRFR